MDARTDQPGKFGRARARHRTGGTLRSGSAPERGPCGSRSRKTGNDSPFAGGGTTENYFSQAPRTATRHLTRAGFGND